jgi:hypothetical protein
MTTKVSREGLRLNFALTDSFSALQALDIVLDRLLVEVTFRPQQRGMPRCADVRHHLPHHTERADVKKEPSETRKQNPSDGPLAPPKHQKASSNLIARESFSSFR